MKIIARVGNTQATKEKEKGPNFEKLPRAHYLEQSPLAKHVQGGVQVGKTHLPLVGLPSLPKVTKKA